MRKQIFAKVITKSLWSSLWDVISEFFIYLLHFKGFIQARRYRNYTDLKLHLGCGKNVKDGWINIDLNLKADLSLDLRKNLPFSDNSSSIIYSEHFLEHLEYPSQATSLLKEAYRVLEPGGIFTVGVPDTE